ncbi:MAG TPA: hypothetical protein VGY58_13890, partial [Gemmataceae bacterium]|nr:hypothetical protein [Gemmataceae bacterium]
PNRPRPDIPLHRLFPAAQKETVSVVSAVPRGRAKNFGLLATSSKVAQARQSPPMAQADSLKTEAGQ